MAWDRPVPKSKDNSMRLGSVLGYSGADMSLPIDRVLEAERLRLWFDLGKTRIWLLGSLRQDITQLPAG